jgi:hypothetical protein
MADNEEATKSEAEAESHASHAESEEEPEAAVVAAETEKEKPAEEAPVKCDHVPIGERIAKDPLEMNIWRKLPNFPEFLTIPKISEARTVWRTGIRKIEEVWAEHIANMHLDFEKKAMHYEKI